MTETPEKSSLIDRLSRLVTFGRMLWALAAILFLIGANVLGDLRGQVRAEERTSATLDLLKVRLDTDKLVMELRVAALTASLGKLDDIVRDGRAERRDLATLIRTTSEKQDAALATLSTSVAKVSGSLEALQVVLSSSLRSQVRPP